MSLFPGCRSISKVGVRSPNQRQDVNLTVAWWGPIGPATEWDKVTGNAV